MAINFEAFKSTTSSRLEKVLSRFTDDDDSPTKIYVTFAEDKDGNSQFFYIIVSDLYSDITLVYINGIMYMCWKESTDFFAQTYYYNYQISYNVILDDSLAKSIIAKAKKLEKSANDRYSYNYMINN